MYRCEATSERGFIQQLAVSYVGNGYVFYVSGWIPAKKDPGTVDAKLISRYGVDVSKWARARRKRAGLACVHYIRFGRLFVLLATRGEHPIFQEEPGIRDLRRDALAVAGYSISLKEGAGGKWHPSVRIHPQEYLKLKAYLLDICVHRSPANLAEEFRRIKFEPYAPVRRQLLNILRAVNRERKTAGFEPLPWTVLRLRRQPVRPFAADDGFEGRQNETVEVAEGGRRAARKYLAVIDGNG